MDIVVRMTSLGPRALEHASTWPPQDILVYRIPLMVLTELLKMARQSMVGRELHPDWLPLYFLSRLSLSPERTSPIDMNRIKQKSVLPLGYRGWVEKMLPLQMSKEVRKNVKRMTEKDRCCGDHGK
ncbi:uncharacterized protein LOC141529307 isoform X1 [Cotesia typhae]|uniref:uncharacterized protein LOC141529307 isoform X1 n=1 Tax=Cotesia typhae TaxID=2053667 RepID=UPI003D681642